MNYVVFKLYLTKIKRTTILMTALLVDTGGDRWKYGLFPDCMDTN